MLPAGDGPGVLDVGPTDDWSRLGIPLTDSRIDFEDVMVVLHELRRGLGRQGRDARQRPVVLAWVDYGEGRYGLRLVDGASLKGVHVTADAEVALGGGRRPAGPAGRAHPAGATAATSLNAVVAVMGVDNPFRGTGDLLVVHAKDAVALADLVIDARAIDNSKLEVSLEQTSGTITPRVFGLYANYPNPFNPMTKISFSLPEAQAVKLTVYTVDGRRVATLVNEVRGPGLHEVIWNGQDDAGRQSASGVYFYRVDAGPYSQVRKMTLMK